jgi:hypothetical protein
MSHGRATKAAIKDFADLATIIQNGINASTSAIMARLDGMEARIARIERHTLGSGEAVPFTPSSPSTFVPERGSTTIAATIAPPS